MVRMILTADVSTAPSTTAPVRRLAFHYQDKWPKEPLKQTERIISAVTSGTAPWLSNLPEDITIDNAFPESHLGPVPTVPFDRPQTPKEISVSPIKPLIAMVSSDRLRDGWDHGIRINLEVRNGHPLLVATSAGPDGKWNTKDDLAVDT